MSHEAFDYFAIGAIFVLVGAAGVIKFSRDSSHKNHRQQLKAYKSLTRAMYELLQLKGRLYPLDSRPVPNWVETSHNADDYTAEVHFLFSYRQGQVRANFSNSGYVDVEGWDFKPKRFRADSSDVVEQLNEHLTLLLGYQEPAAPPPTQPEDEAATAQHGVTVGSSPRN